MMIHRILCFFSQIHHTTLLLYLPQETVYSFVSLSMEIAYESNIDMLQRRHYCEFITVCYQPS